MPDIPNITVLYKKNQPRHHSANHYRENKVQMIETLCSMIAAKTITSTCIWDVEAAAPSAIPSARKQFNLIYTNIQKFNNNFMSIKTSFKIMDIFLT